MGNNHPATYLYPTIGVRPVTIYLQKIPTYLLGFLSPHITHTTTT